MGESYGGVQVTFKRDISDEGIEKVSELLRLLTFVEDVQPIKRNHFDPQVTRDRSTVAKALEELAYKVRTGKLKDVEE